MKAVSAAKKPKLALIAIDQPKTRNESLERHNEIMVFSNAPEEYNSTAIIEYSNLLRAETLQNARKRAAANSDSGKATDPNSANASFSSLYLPASSSDGKDFNNELQDGYGRHKI